MTRKGFSVLVLLIALAVAGTALATEQRRSATSPLAATLAGHKVSGENTICQGEDGPYLKIGGVFEGTATGDPRISGNVRVAVVKDFVHLTDGFGIVKAKIEVRDPATNDLKMNGGFVAVNSGRGKVDGLITARTHRPEGRVLANFSLQFDQTGTSYVGQFGDVAGPPAQNTAVWSDRACTSENRGDH